MPKKLPNKIPKDMSNKIPKNILNRIPNKISKKNISDRMSENLSIKKIINVMVGNIQNKIIFQVVLIKFREIRFCKKTMFKILKDYFFLHTNHMKFRQTWFYKKNNFSISIFFIFPYCSHKTQTSPALQKTIFQALKNICIATLWLGGPRGIKIFQFHVPPQFLLHWRGSLIYDLFEQCPWSTMPYCGSTWPKLAQQECSKLLEMTRAAAQNCLALLKVAQNCSKCPKCIKILHF